METKVNSQHHFKGGIKLPASVGDGAIKQFGKEFKGKAALVDERLHAFGFYFKNPDSESAAIQYLNKAGISYVHRDNPNMTPREFSEFSQNSRYA